MCACNFNMQFTHVLVEREGSVKLLILKSDPKHGIINVLPRHGKKTKNPSLFVKNFPLTPKKYGEEIS